MRDAFVRTMEELLAADGKIFLMTADLGFGIFDEIEERFPEQYLNVGVAEQNMIGVATGLALEGRTVFAYSIGNFPTFRCLEQIRNDACYHGANVKIVASGGGFSYGALGMSHHATEDLAVLRALPGITVVAPADPWEAEAATRNLARTAGVGYLRIDKTSARPTGRPQETFVLGKARRLREGSDATLIATGGIVAEALKAADQLERLGRSVRVVSMHTVKPIDVHEILAAAKDTRGIVTIEEHNRVGGLGGAVAEVCFDNGVALDLFSRLGLKDEYTSIVGQQDYLRARYGLDAPAIVATVLRGLEARRDASIHEASH